MKAGVLMYQIERIDRADKILAIIGSPYEAEQVNAARWLRRNIAAWHFRIDDLHSSLDNNNLRATNPTPVGIGTGKISGSNNVG